MNLKEFVEETGIPITRLADRCGLSFHQVYHVLNGNVPTLKTALAIEHYTKGQVTTKDMVSPEILAEIYNNTEDKKDLKN